MTNWTAMFGLKRDAQGRLLDDKGAIMGDFREWKNESRGTREAAMVACLNALDGRAALPSTIGSNPIVAMYRIAHVCPEGHLVTWAADQLAARGAVDVADTLRGLARAAAGGDAAAADIAARHGSLVRWRDRMTPVEA
jgi:hypothetical protein